MADNFNTRLYARGYAASVPTRQPSPAPAPSGCCAPACVTCGLLECLCRPRFFAGQLLTETDLNRLDSYIRAKNRMHNLQLHGWGVVNGLQVHCGSCGDGVIVGTGYAIDPCGEDIIVCKDTPVDICSLIKRCQNIDITCVPSTRFQGNTNCDDVEEDWVLTIRYNETQSRGITALKSTPSCACGAKAGACSCGGGGNCGCTKKTTSTAPTNPITTQSTQKPRNAPTECEATAICEGYTFDVFLAPTDVPKREPNQLSGGLIDTMMCCIEPLQNSLPKPPGGQYGNYGQNAIAWNLWCCRMKEALIAFFSTGPQANCTLVTQLQGLACPDPESQSFDAEMQQMVKYLTVFLLEALIACMCSALLPPAPCGTSDDCVPLAIVTVRKKDCKVIRVCNWTHLRKLVVTWPTLEYWFGWIPWFKSLQDAIGAFCCADIKLPRREETGVYTNAHATDYAAMRVNPTLDAQLVKDNQTMSALLMDAFTRGGAALDPKALLDGVFGVGAPSKTPLSETEKLNVAPFLLLNQVMRPVAASAVPEDTAALHLRVAALEKALAEMKGKAHE